MATLLHDTSRLREFPNLPFGIGPAFRPGDVDAFGRAVRLAYVAAVRPGERPADLWSSMEQRSHSAFIRLLEGEDDSAVAQAIYNLHMTALGFGFTVHGGLMAQVREDRALQVHLSREVMDGLLSVAERLGCMDIENPEAKQAGAAMAGDAVEVYRRICAEIGIDLHGPRAFACGIGMIVDGALVDRKCLLALSTALRLCELLDGLGIARADARILEIGGGTGHLAYYARRLGIGSYTIVDLPHVSAIQHFMGLVDFPGTGVGTVLDGPKIDLDRPFGTYPAWATDSLPDRSVDIVVNEDSFPEMAEEIGLGYMALIRRVCRHVLLSLNHESRETIKDHPHTTVRDLARKAGGLRPLSRHRHWVRAGYVEELYRPE